MSEQDLNQILDNLSMSVVLADLDNKPTVAEVLKRLDELREAIPDATAELSGRLDEISDIVTNILLDDTEDPKADLERVSEIIQAIQSSFNNPDNGQGKAAGGSEAAKGFELPDYVDEKLLQDFFTNWQNNLEEIEADILALEEGNSERIADLKRQLHTLKGEAGVLGLNDVEHVCHILEDHLDTKKISPQWIDAFLRARDWLLAALESYSEKQYPAVPAEELIEMLNKINENPSESEMTSKEAGSDDQPDSELVIETEKAQSAAEEKFVYDSDLEESTETDDFDVDAEEASVPKHIDRDPELDAMIADFVQESEEGLTDADQILLNIEQEDADPEKINTLFRIFHTIKGVAGFLEFRQIGDLAHESETLLNLFRKGTLRFNDAYLDVIFRATEMMRIMIEDVQAAVEESREPLPIQGAKELIGVIKDACEGRLDIDLDVPDVNPDASVGEILKESGRIPPDAIDRALAGQQETGRRIGEELIARGDAKAKDVADALRAQMKARGGKAHKIRETVKVDLTRVDNLVELVGEMVILQSMVNNTIEIQGSTTPALQNYMNQLTKATRDLQDLSMSLRMVPIAGVFQKMARMVRDLSHKGNKKIHLVKSGEGTEVDRNMVEQIGDPLVHMIRNAVDHGIEPPEERRAAGKPEMGEVRLSAYHEGGRIVIELSDDGRGLDSESIRKKAIEKGLISEADVLSESEIFNLIFAPGFSTAKKVTEISGRGVGMDVVRQNIDAMRGRIHIESELGKGTTFRLMLPLTLAIIDGMQIACGQERFIIPTLSIVELLRPTESMLATFATSSEMINIRGEMLSLLKLADLLDIGDVEKDPTNALIVVVESMDRKVGIMVDDVLAEQQVVLKQIGAGAGNIKYSSGSAIMSDGSVGLVLNVEEITMLSRHVQNSENQSTFASGSEQKQNQEMVN